MPNLNSVIADIINPGLALLPAKMDSRAARVLLLAMGLQESNFEHVRQIGGGPGRGNWQFEPGTKLSRGGVWGIYLHSASRGHLESICRIRGVQFEPHAIWLQIERDAPFACACARLLMWTDAGALPAADDELGGWSFYAGVWRPGRPRFETWAANHRDARQACGVA